MGTGPLFWTCPVQFRGGLVRSRPVPSSPIPWELKITLHFESEKNSGDLILPRGKYDFKNSLKIKYVLISFKSDKVHDSLKIYQVIYIYQFTCQYLSIYIYLFLTIYLFIYQVMVQLLLYHDFLWAPGGYFGNGPCLLWTGEDEFNK